jgi:hypothetical protein
MSILNDLHAFCACIVRKYGRPDAASEEQKAEELRKIYLRGLPLELKTLKALAVCCGIKVDALESENMPRNLRGYHEIYEGNRNLYYKKGDTVSGIENTILHEIREMMETTFAEICPSYEPLRTIARHTAANKFATAVLLPREDFINKVYETGLDVVELAKFYSKSCSQVLLRMGEVLQGRLFLFGALYERDAESHKLTLTYWTGSSNNDNPEANLYGADGLFPRKGATIIPGSLVGMAIQDKKPCFAPDITLSDISEDDGLVAIARPLIISGELTKIALVVLLAQNRSLLEPQIERLKPLTQNGFYRHL